jgi:Asp-tRNA(Asn)/Glu-tRNA(Gln) amidotransferase A subunit family amidase
VTSGGIWTWSACDLADAVREGRLKAAEVIEVFLDRIRRFDPEIRSFVYVDVEGSRRQAEEIDRRVGGGEDPGPLAGVPVAV